MQKAKVVALVIFAAFAVVAFKTGEGERAVAGKTSFGSVPGIPTNLTATDLVYATKVGLHWDPIRDATLYRVYRSQTNNSANAVEIGSTPANFFFDTSAVASTQYYYWVRAENGSGEGGLSNSDAGMRAVGNNNPVAPFPPLQPPIEPGGNPITASKAALGKTLFWDEQLSSTKTVSCGTCHRPAAGGSDPRTNTLTRHPGADNILNTPDDSFGSPGVPNVDAQGNYSPIQFFGMGIQVTPRKAPSYLNAGYTTDGIFWDGRASDQFRDPITNAIILSSFGGLESQAVFPPLSSVEMGHFDRDWSSVVSRVQSSQPLVLAHDVPTSLSNWIDGRSYPELFQEAFGSPVITPARISMAISTHERTLFSDQTPLDRWSAQLESLTTLEETGRTIFVNQQCTFCHGGALLSNATYQNVGVRPVTDDPGRGAITGIQADIGRFKTPPLRNLELRSHFMHNGSLASIEDVVEFYNRGGDFPAPNFDPRVRPLNLTVQQRAALVAFLKRPLTDVRVRDELPPFDRPKLYTESEYVPEITGSGREGTGSIIPEAIAIEPPVIGNSSFAIAVGKVPAGANAVLVINSTDPGVGSAIPSFGSFGVRNVTTLGSGTNGYGTAILSIPNDAQLIGTKLYARWYVTDKNAANGFSVSRLISFTIFGNRSKVPTTVDAPYDFDGDGKTDVSVFRPSVGEWWYLRSSDQVARGFQFGSGTDAVAAADYTGDGKADVAFFRPTSGEWFILRSEDSSFYAFPFGAAGDVAMLGDYDGDGKADPAVFRPSTGNWFILRSSDQGVTVTHFGQDGDRPATGDFDGDGKTDAGIFRPSVGEWWYLRSSDQVARGFQFGSSTDKTVVGDYTGDGKADVAFFRPASGEWFILRSEDSSFYAFPFGNSTDIPAPGDYDGDGKTDPAVFRPSTGNWFVLGSTAGVTATHFGQSGDSPIPAAAVR